MNTNYSSNESEIRACYARQNIALAEWQPGMGYSKWCAMSQYGKVMDDGHNTQAEAEQFVVNYYSKHMNCIRQTLVEA